mgnify:CR=1 FL=1
MEIQSFKSSHEMVEYLKGLKPADHFRIAKAHGIRPANKADAHLYADYIVQGVQKGLTGPSLVMYAETNVARLQSVMPHLKSQEPAPVVETPSVAKPKVKATPKPKVAKVKKAKVAKRKHPDFTIVARPDRGGFEGWYGGRAEAFRDTVEKVQSFFQKKYQQSGQVLS